MRVSMILVLSALSGLVSAVPMIPSPVRLFSFLPTCFIEPVSLHKTDLSTPPSTKSTWYDAHWFILPMY